MSASHAGYRVSERRSRDVNRKLIAHVRLTGNNLYTLQAGRRNPQSNSLLPWFCAKLFFTRCCKATLHSAHYRHQYVKLLSSSFGYHRRMRL